MPAEDGRNGEQTSNPRRRLRDVLAFFGLTYLFTIPFWAVGEASGDQLMPGLPIAALAVVCPATAALLLSWRRGGPAGGRALLSSLDLARVKPWAWWILVVLIFPTISAASFFILKLEGSAVPFPQIKILPALALSAVFLIGGICEELGWSGFALNPLQRRIGALPAALLIGAIWAVWHYPALLQAHRALRWIAWWTLGTVSTRLFMVWLHNKAGDSVMAVAIVHAISNLCWQLFPVHGSWFDIRLNALIVSGVALGSVLTTTLRNVPSTARAHD